MANKLLEFIAIRMSELASEEAVLRERLGAIEQERVALRKAEIAARGPLLQNTQAANKGRAATGRIKPNTIMDSVIKILERYPDGLIALDILAKLNEGRETPYLRTSLSPQLSRLKQGGFIELDGSVWKLLKREDDADA